MRPLLVGESNPYGVDPDFALYPLPEHASGGRLARFLGLSRGQYLRSFDRRNLCVGPWSIREARAAAKQIITEARLVILLGSKVSSAFGITFAPFTRTGELFVLPHPSGLNRIWSEPDAVPRARALLADVLKEILKEVA